jgi:hypothetical protein
MTQTGISAPERDSEQATQGRIAPAGRATAAEAALPIAVPAESVGGGDAAKAWAALTIDSKRAALVALVTVTILPSGIGKTLDPDTARVTRKSGSPQRSSTAASLSSILVFSNFAVAAPSAAIVHPGVR